MESVKLRRSARNVQSNGREKENIDQNTQSCKKVRNQANIGNSFRETRGMKRKREANNSEMISNQIPHTTRPISNKTSVYSEMVNEQLRCSTRNVHSNALVN